MKKTGMHFLLLAVFLMAQMGAAAVIPTPAAICDGSCCETGACECRQTPTDAPVKSVPALPAPDVELKYVPVLLATFDFSFPAASGVKDMVPAGSEWLIPHTPALLRLHCALLL